MTPDFAQTIEAAIVSNWRDLLSNRPDGSVHVEYAFAPGGALNHLEVWSSTVRGHWLLACTYSIPPPFPGGNMRFDNGIQSTSLAQMLDVVMQHQTAFRLPENLGPHGLLQIASPSPDERSAAEVTIHDALVQISGAGGST
jgi:hypothetical protein